MTYDDIRAALDRAAATDPQLRSLTKKIRAGKATFIDTAAYSQRLSALLGQVFSAEVEAMSPEEREAICRALLRGHYEEINRILEGVQETLDEAQGLSLTPQRAPYPSERVGQLAHSLQDATVPVETIRRRADTGAANVAHAMHDDYIDVNAKLRNDLGLKCYLTRVVGSTSCTWCANLAGRFVYGQHPDDIFRRHDNCTCTVTYACGRERQDVWSKRTWGARDPKEVMRQAREPVKLTQEQAARLQENALQQLTLAGERDIMRSIDVDDYETVTYGKGIAKEVSNVILDTMKQCERDGGFIISEISTKVVPTSTHGTPILQIEPMSNGLLKLNVNANFLAGKTLAEVDEAFRITETNVVNSLMEAVIHESGHAISIKGKTMQEIKTLYKELKNAGLPGVSDIALADGAECLAELEVLRHRGTKVSDELAAFYKKYMGRDYE